MLGTGSVLRTSPELTWCLVADAYGNGRGQGLGFRV